MTSVYFHLHESDGKPRAEVVGIGVRPFICLHLSDTVSAYMQGYEHVNVAYARAIAATLTDAADQLEQLLRPGVEDVAAVLR